MLKSGPDNVPLDLKKFATELRPVLRKLLSLSFARKFIDIISVQYGFET